MWKNRYHQQLTKADIADLRVRLAQINNELTKWGEGSNMNLKLSAVPSPLFHDSKLFLHLAHSSQSSRGGGYTVIWGDTGLT